MRCRSSYCLYNNLRTVLFNFITAYCNREPELQPEVPVNGLTSEIDFGAGNLNNFGAQSVTRHFGRRVLPDWYLHAMGLKKECFVSITNAL